MKSSGVVTASVDNSTLGFEAPSLFLAQRSARPATNATLYVFA